MEEKFIDACYNGNLELAKQIYELTLNADNNIQIDIHDNNDSAFRNTCGNGHLEVAKWLLTLDKFSSFNVEEHKEIFDKIKKELINETMFQTQFILGNTNIYKDVVGVIQDYLILL